MGRVHDAVIIGCGPAGGMAGLAAARGGLDVVLLDRKKEVGVPVACGEAISVFSLKNTGLERREEWVAGEVRGMKVVVPNGKHFLMKLPGLSLRRDLFDRHIVDLTREKGAKVHLDTGVSKIRRSGGRWKLRTREGVLSARCVVAADGPRSRMAPMAELGVNTRFVAAMQYKLESGAPSDPDWLEFHYAQKFPDGYGWIFPREGHLNVGVCGTGIAKSSLDLFVRRAGLAKKKVIATNAGPIPSGGPVDRFHSDGLLLAGDAAGLVNPCTYGGIHAALYSGKLAGEAIVSRVRDGDEAALTGYERTLRASPFCDEVLMRGARAIYTLPDHVWDFIGDVSHGRQTPAILSRKGVSAFLRRPGLLRHLNRLRTMRKASRVYSVYGW